MASPRLEAAVSGKAARLLRRTCIQDEPGLELVSPCKCTGSQAFVHRACLHHWQRVLCASGQEAKARRCGVCNQPFTTKMPKLSWSERLLACWGRAANLWMAAAVLGGAVGGGTGTLVAVEVVITLAAELFLWADCRGADSAFVGILATLLMPMLLPSLALAAYSAVICFATAGFALGAVTAALGTPLLLLHALRVSLKMSLSALAAVLTNGRGV